MFWRSTRKAYSPTTPTLLSSSIILAASVTDSLSEKDFTPSPALKPMPPVPHWMSIYMKKTNDFSPSVARAAWNVFRWMYKENWRFNYIKGWAWLQLSNLAVYHTEIHSEAVFRLGLADLEWGLSSMTELICTCHVISAQLYLSLWKNMEWFVANCSNCCT